MTAAERGSLAKEIADELLDAMEARGVPPGAWLVEIAQVRQALSAADSTLRRMQDAIIRAAAPTEIPS